MKKTDSCEEIFRKLNILSLPSIYILECAIFKKKNNDTFSRYKFNHDYNTRNSKTMCSIKHKTTTHESAPHFICIIIFNKLPENITNQKILKIILN